MAEENQQQFGEGSDNYGQAANQAAKAAQAAKNAGKEAAKQAAAKGAEATANAAAATVQASVEGGKVAAEIAAGTASGGPWGAILSIAWSLRHTLFKVLVCICLAVLFIVVFIVALPGIIVNEALGLAGIPPEATKTIVDTVAEITDSVMSVIGTGYDNSKEEVERIILSGGYDYDLSMNALIDYTQTSAGYDTAYIMAAYSASMDMQSLSRDDMITKLSSVSSNMFPVTAVEKHTNTLVPVTYYTYKPVTLTVVTDVVYIGTIDDVPQYRYETDEKTYYLQDQQLSSDTSIEIDAYTAVAVDLPIYTNGQISGVRTETYYVPNGRKTVNPTIETVKYVECTIHPFDNTATTDAFGIDLEANYLEYNTTYGEAIDHMTYTLKQTMYGSMNTEQADSLSDEEINTFVDRQNCSEDRKQIIQTGLSLVGRVPYFWGGKSDAGWNDEWNTPKLVTSAGSPTSGTIRPYGLDCSGFVDWVYKTAVGLSLGTGTGDQYENTYAISESELLPGDLGFLMDDDGQGWNHVLIFAGYGENGERMWVHSTSGEGVVLNTPDYDNVLVLRRPMNIDSDASDSDFEVAV